MREGDILLYSDRKVAKVHFAIVQPFRLRYPTVLLGSVRTIQLRLQLIFPRKTLNLHRSFFSTHQLEDHFFLVERWPGSCDSAAVRFGGEKSELRSVGTETGTFIDSRASSLFPSIPPSPPPPPPPVGKRLPPSMARSHFNVRM